MMSLPNIQDLSENRWFDEVVHSGWSDDLPMSGSATGIGGDMGDKNTDFEVEEVPAYSPSGQGEHVYLWIEKNGKGTPEAIKEIIKAFGVKEIDVGYAGKKDAHAVTRQWVSIHTPNDDNAPIDQLNDLGWLRVLRTTRHANKLRLGHLKGNIFKVRIVETTQDDDAIQSAIESLRRQGFINYFGKQRFGFDGGNVAEGMAILAGKRAPHQKRLLLVSAVQSAIFNLMAAARFVHSGNIAFAGDVLQKINAGCFVCDDPQIDTPRIAAGEVAVTLPLFGKKVMPAHGDVSAFETQAAQAFFAHWQADENAARGAAFDTATLAKFAAGDRRQFVILPSLLNFIRIDTSCIDVHFALPSGCYATVLLRHLCGTSFTR